jgi:hypothetical protein
MFILTCMYIILAILEKIIQYINIYLFTYWIIFHLTIYGHHARRV